MDGKGPLHIPLILLIATAAMVAEAIAIVGSEEFSQSAATVVAIAKMEIGAAPAQFNFARPGQSSPGQWSVVRDATAFNDRVIEQSRTDRTDRRFPLAIYRPIPAKNVESSVRFKPAAGRVDQAGGVAALDSNNYYVMCINALEDNLRFDGVKGSRAQIDGVNIKVANNVWHTLALEAEGERFTVGYGGKTCSRRPIEASPTRARLRFGQKPTA